MVESALVGYHLCTCWLPFPMRHRQMHTMASHNQRQGASMPPSRSNCLVVYDLRIGVLRSDVLSPTSDTISPAEVIGQFWMGVIPGLAV